MATRRELYDKAQEQIDIINRAWAVLFTENLNDTQIAALCSEHAFAPPEALGHCIAQALHEGFSQVINEVNQQFEAGSFADVAEYYSTLLHGVEAYSRLTAVRMFFIGQKVVATLPQDELVPNEVYWVADDDLEQLLGGGE